jgi:hypothetical protein
MRSKHCGRTQLKVTRMAMDVGCCTLWQLMRVLHRVNRLAKRGLLAIFCSPVMWLMASVSNVQSTQRVAWSTPTDTIWLRACDEWSVKKFSPWCWWSELLQNPFAIPMVVLCALSMNTFIVRRFLSRPQPKDCFQMGQAPGFLTPLCTWSRDTCP